MITAALAVLLAVFTVIKFLADNEFRTFWAWLGLILAIVIVVGAWMNMQAAGESLTDVRNRMSSMTAGAGASRSTSDAPPAPVDSRAAQHGGDDTARTSLRSPSEPCPIGAPPA